MAPTVHIACLCAAWCRLCEEYAAVLDQVVASFREDGLPVQVHWIDIEDEEALVGDVEVETFPTLFLITGSAGHPVVRFAGPVTPQAGTLSRLLRAVVADAAAGSPAAAVPTEILAFADRLARRVDSGRARSSS